MSFEEVLLVYKARYVFESEMLQKKFPALAGFPNGSCETASVILGMLLNMAGYGPYLLMHGKNGTLFHAWLESETTLVDITTDQFAELDHSVMLVQKVTAAPISHLGFKVIATFELGQEDLKNIKGSFFLVFKELCREISQVPDSAIYF